VGDAGSDLSHLGKFDIVMANASLQWLPNHGELLPRLAQLLNSGGALAVQIPKFPDMPIAQTISEVTRLPHYAELFADFHSGMHYFDDRFYYDVLAPVCRAVELWVTHYYHVLTNLLS
jgi:trans-aconitate 2-methyltransferase